jgi:hypothetical protein
MKAITFFCFLSALVLCTTYEELSKYSSVSVKPDEYVYLDITSFKTNEMITLEIIMDLFFGSSSQQSSYTFQIGQVSASSYKDYYAWNSLPTRINKNVTRDGSDYIFSWTEVKEEGKNYLFIIPPAPFRDYYSFWGKKIKIKNTGGMSTASIVWMVVGISLPLIVVIVLVICCIKRKRQQEFESAINPNANLNQGPMYSQPSYQAPTPVYQQPPTYQQPIDFQQPTYQQPLNYQQHSPYQQQPPTYQQI